MRLLYKGIWINQRDCFEHISETNQYICNICLTIWTKLGSPPFAFERSVKTFACPSAVAERVSSPLYARRTRKRRDRDAVASPFPSKSGLRPKVLLSSRRRSPGCEGYTRSGCTSRASDLQTWVGGHLIPNCTYIHGCNANERTYTGRIR